MGMNNDRILELYNREIWDARLQEIARDRVHWLCAQAKGKRVLDVGCSQGIVPMLLAREGFKVLGIDLNPKAIEYAKDYQAREFPFISDRCTFVCADIFDYEPEGTFDTLILSEVLEHFSDPTVLLDHVLRYLNPGGRIVITVPFGVHRDQDHKSTHTLRTIHDLLAPHASICHLDVAGKYVRAVGEYQTPPPALSPEADRTLLRKLLELTDKGLLDAENNYLDKQREIVDRLARQDAIVKEVGELRKKAETDARAAREAAEAAKQHARECEVQQAFLAKQIEQLKAEAAERTARLSTIEKELRAKEHAGAETAALLAEARSRASSLEERQEEFKAARSALEQEARALHAKASETAALLQARETELKHLNDKLDAAVKERGALQTEVQALREKIAAKKALREGLESRLQQLRDEHAHELLRISKEHASIHDQTVAKWARELREAESRAQAADSQLQSLRSQMETEKAVHAREIEALTSSLRTLEREHAAAHAKSTQLEAKLSREKRALADATSWIETLEDDLKRKDQQAEALRAEIRQAQETLKKNDAQLADALERIRVLEDEAVQRTNALRLAQSESSAAQAEAASHKARLAQAETQLNKLRASSESYLQEMREKARALEDTARQLREANSLASSLEARCHSLKQQAANSDAEVRRLYAENTRKHDNYNRIRNSVSYQFGRTTLRAIFRPGMNTLRLPADVYRIAREGLRQRREGGNIMAEPAAVAATPPPPQVQFNPTPTATPAPAPTPTATPAPAPTPAAKPAPAPTPPKAPSPPEPTRTSTSGEPSAKLPVSIDTTASIEPLPFETQPRNARRKLRVASILDDFTHACFAPECELIPIRPDNWLELMSEGDIDFLFVESAWHGNKDAWLYRVAKYNAPPGNELADVLAWCHKLDIPTVFWNKEDPPNFDRFVDRASEFQYVFTTDANCIPRYRERCPNVRRIEALAFAAQPAIHNPMMEQERLRKTCFAGTYYADEYAKRRDWMDVMLRASTEFGLDIFDRMHGTTGPQAKRFEFPADLQPHIRGKLSYDEMIRAYRRYRAFLNVNSVYDSPTMFSRRVFELLACGTPVVTTPSLGIERFFGSLVPQVETAEQVRAALAPLFADDDAWYNLSAKGIRHTYSSHTYAHRMKTICEVIGLPTESFDAPPIVVVAHPAGDPDSFARAMAAQSVRPANVLVPGIEAHDAQVLAHRQALERAGFDTITLPLHNIPALIDARFPESIIALCDTRRAYGANYMLDARHSVMGDPETTITGTLPPSPGNENTQKNWGLPTDTVLSGTLVARSSVLSSQLLEDAYGENLARLPYSVLCRYGYEVAENQELMITPE
ncbi:MAG: hypothetical protein PWP23_404 [Candidatus Sumerlaeota bacterium]|nr:hypothetical protein [Candidatus Sumerlaeota bacterium]